MTDYFVHERALCESQSVGKGTRVWAFAHVLPGARIGADCNICDGVFIENDVVVGDRVTIKCGVQLWDGVRLEDDVFVGPNATFTNDPFPRSKVYPSEWPTTIVRKGASIGANATLLPGIVIGERAMVGAGAVVTRDVPADAVVVGNPARPKAPYSINSGELAVTAGGHSVALVRADARGQREVQGPLHVVCLEGAVDLIKGERRESLAIGKAHALVAGESARLEFEPLAAFALLGRG